MNKLLLIGGLLSCMLSVVLGAFGAHSLTQIVGEKGISTFEIGVRYQFYHGLALLFCALLFKNYPQKFITIAGYLFIAGIFLFSGSLYLLAFNQVADLPSQLIGPLTPLGGVCFIAGWTTLLIGCATILDFKK